VILVKNKTCETP